MQISQSHVENDLVLYTSGWFLYLFGIQACLCGIVFFVAAAEWITYLVMGPCDTCFGVKLGRQDALFNCPMAIALTGWAFFYFASYIRLNRIVLSRDVLTIRIFQAPKTMTIVGLFLPQSAKLVLGVKDIKSVSIGTAKQLNCEPKKIVTELRSTCTTSRYAPWCDIELKNGNTHRLSPKPFSKRAIVLLTQRLNELGIATKWW
jgi:hypothetical protein